MRPTHRYLRMWASASGICSREEREYTQRCLPHCSQCLFPTWPLGLQGWCNTLFTMLVAKTTSTLTGLLSTPQWWILAANSFWQGAIELSYWKWLLKTIHNSPNITKGFLSWLSWQPCVMFWSPVPCLVKKYYKCCLSIFLSLCESLPTLFLQ